MFFKQIWQSLVLWLCKENILAKGRVVEKSHETFNIFFKLEAYKLKALLMLKMEVLEVKNKKKIDDKERPMYMICSKIGILHLNFFQLKDLLLGKG